MKERFKQAVKHPLVSGSVVILVGSMMANVLSWLFNLGAGRLLASAAEYGTLIALVSVFNIFSVFSTTISTVFTKFTATYVAQKKEHLIGSLFISGSLWVGMLSFLVVGFLILFASYISHFLNIDSVVFVILTSAALFFSFLSYVTIGIIQGLLKFGFFCFINIFSSLIKLVLGLGLIAIGFKVLGAISAIFLSVLVTYLLAFISLIKFLRKIKKNNFVIPNLKKNLLLYALPVFLSNIGITAFISIDVILVKHFFSATVSGQYAALSIMGRSIFYAVAPIGFVLFPIIAQKKERKEKLTGTLLLATLIVQIPSIFLSFIYFVFPKFVLKIFYPAKEYAVLYPYLGQFSIFILLYLLCFILNTFYLSIGKTRVFIFTVAANILEIIYIVFFHKDIYQIIFGLIVVSFVLLLSLISYYFLKKD